MSLYVNGVLQAGVNDIPSYTRAEYEALTEKPEYWICTDEDYSDLSAENVTYGSGTVKDALDALKIKTKTVTGTTSSSGGLYLGLTYPDNIVLYAVESGGGYPIMVGAYQSSWIAVVTNNPTSGDITPVRNQQVTLKVAYI